LVNPEKMDGTDGAEPWRREEKRNNDRVPRNFCEAGISNRGISNVEVGKRNIEGRKRNIDRVPCSPDRKSGRNGNIQQRNVEC